MMLLVGTITAVLLLSAGAIVALSHSRTGRGTGVFADVPGASRGRTALAQPGVVTSSPPADPRAVDVVVPDSGMDLRRVGVARREFLNRSTVSLLVVGSAAFGSAMLAFLWRSSSGGFGSKINVGKLTDIKAAIANGGGFHYVPAGKMWITEFPSAARDTARDSYRFYSRVEPGLDAGVTALYQKCPHLGCRVPACASSQWFECPCHGSKFNRVGEKKAGPAPRGLDRFPMTLNAAGELIVDTGSIIPGPAIGTNTTGQEAEGPSCVGSVAGHE